VKGHYKGEQELCHLLNVRVDELARSYNSNIRKPPQNPLPLPPNYEIELLQGYHQLTSRVTNMISKELHTSPIEEYIKKRAGWPTKTFMQVDWEAHHQAISTYK
jgi:hypothetical protein